jgi:hypothetical protein
VIRTDADGGKEGRETGGFPEGAMRDFEPLVCWTLHTLHGVARKEPVEMMARTDNHILHILHTLHTIHTSVVCYYRYRRL